MVILALVCFAVGFSSCSMMYYPAEDVYSPNYESSAYSNWKAEQKAITQKQLDYANSPAYKAKYSGTSKGNNLPGARAGSVVGTTADPLHNVRQPNMGVPNTTVGVRIYK